MVSISHGFRSVRLAADFATPVATILDPVGVTKEPPILSRTRKVVTNSVDYDKTVVYLCEGRKIIDP